VAETPIRGRWTATHWLCPECNAFDGPISDGCCDVCLHDGNIGQAVQPLVPVPDEAAIERGAKAAFEARFLSDMRAVALAVLRAALDPDAQPETPEERHHRELHDGTLNEMPPEERHARAGS
jgi:hypothetical protein